MVVLCGATLATCILHTTVNIHNFVYQIFFHQSIQDPINRNPVAQSVQRRLYFRVRQCHFRLTNQI